MEMEQIIDIIKQVFEILSIPAAIVGGGVGVYFWRENKALKKVAVKEKGSEVSDKQQRTGDNQNEECGE